VRVGIAFGVARAWLPSASLRVVTGFTGRIQCGLKAFGERFLVLASLTIAECFALERLLFRDQPEYEFVLASISGVLSGYPVSKSWQHRFLGPWLVRALDPLTHSPLRSLELFTWLGVLLANVLLFSLLKRRGASDRSSYLGLLSCALVHVIYAYRLEYAWDAIDVLLFMTFGFCVAQGSQLLALVPLLVMGTLNHETALYIPFWYTLSLIPWRGAHGASSKFNTRLTEAFTALAVIAGMASAIWLVRERYYVGNPHLPGQTPEAQTPVIANHLHILHNLWQLLVADWRVRPWLSVTLWFLLFLLGRELVRRGRHARAALWTLCVFATIVCFGYVNETRHYLLLVAFWFAYAWPARAVSRSAQNFA
jgi:hypothetical protein